MSNQSTSKKEGQGNSTLVFPSHLAGMITKDSSHPHLHVRHNDPQSPVQEIFLPVPIGITLGDGATYEGLDRGDFVAAENFKNKGAEVMSDADQLAFGLRVAKNLPGLDKISAELMLKNRVATNPMTEMVFNGNAMRTLSLTFAMTPRNSEEANTIRDIVNTFRRLMYAYKSGSSGYTVRYPALFKLVFYSGEQESRFFPIFYDAYLTSMSTNYGAQAGNFIQVDDKQSMYQQHSITLEFAESKMLTRNDLYQGEEAETIIPQSNKDAKMEKNGAIKDGKGLAEGAVTTAKNQNKSKGD